MTDIEYHLAQWQELKKDQIKFNKLMNEIFSWRHKGPDYTVLIEKFDLSVLDNNINFGDSHELFSIEDQKTENFSHDVYKKNFIAAYSRWGPPHIPMRKYMGKSINSQKTKNKKKSKARNTPIIPVSRSRNKAKYPFTPLSIFQLTKIHKNESNGVRIIIGRLNPSTPRA